MSEETPKDICRGLKKDGTKCECDELIEAHIIPRCFARYIMGEQHNMMVTLDMAVRARRQLGEFDKTILCKACDHDLGRLYDEHAFDVLRSFDTRHRSLPDNVFEIPDVDGDRLAKFVLSVLWRASISGLPDYLTLGEYEDAARDVLFGRESFSSMPNFQVMVHRYSTISLMVWICLAGLFVRARGNYRRSRQPRR
jgi:hypothetical protein